MLIKEKQKDQLKSQLIERWQNLASREKSIIIVGTIIGAILLLYTLVWSPFSNLVTSTRHEVNAQRSLITWMEHAIPRLKFLHKSGVVRKSLGEQSLLAFIDSSTKQNRLHHFVTQLEQSPDQKQVILKFDQAPFDEVTIWLTSLWKTYGITAKSASFQATSKTGLTRTELVLQ